MKSVPNAVKPIPPTRVTAASPARERVITSYSLERGRVMRRVMRILVAEEDRDFIEMIKTSLLKTGDHYQVETVFSGDDCLKKLKGEKISS